MTPIVSSGLMMGPFESALRSARMLDAKVIRYGLTTVLCGDRARAWATSGRSWSPTCARRSPTMGRAPLDEGRTLAIENHQDFGSEELVAFCEETRGVGICFDTGNTFPVAEAPLDFTRRDRALCAARASEGLSRPVHRRGLSARALRHRRRRGSRCPQMLDMLAGIIRRLTRRARARRARGAARAAFEARVVERLPAEDRAGAGRVPRGRAGQPAADDADCRTPWERGEDGAIEDYELAMIRRSADNMRAIGLALN